VTQKQAHRMGVESGLEAAQHGDFAQEELLDEDSFMTACGEICENKRQYADHPGYQFGRERNAESLWEAFEHGEMVGIRRGWRMRLRRSKE
jgi:hypothetical protein